MENISLYEMVTDLVELIEVEEINEEVKSEIMEQIKETINNKSENIIKVIKNYEASINAIKEEEKRLAEYRRVKENQLKRLKDYTRDCLEVMDLKKVESPLGRISLRKGSESVQIVDEALIPSQYKEVVETVKIDKLQIKKDLKEKAIEGVELVRGNSSLVIK